MADHVQARVHDAADTAHHHHRAIGIGGADLGVGLLHCPCHVPVGHAMEHRIAYEISADIVRLAGRYSLCTTIELAPNDWACCPPQPENSVQSWNGHSLDADANGTYSVNSTSCHRTEYTLPRPFGE